MSTAEAAPVLDYANPLLAQPVTSDIVVDARKDGFAFVVPPGSRRRAVVSAVISALVAILLIVFGVMILREIRTDLLRWSAVIILFVIGSITSIALFVRGVFMRAAYPTVILTQAGVLLWNRPTACGMRWTRWEPGSIRKVHPRSAGHSLR